jgi:hypothetical protein
MAIVTVEDLQGTIEVVVFPRLFEETRATWTEGRVLLVSGRVDHKGEEAPLLADFALDWDEASARGPEAFVRDVAAADRSRGRGGRSNGNGHSSAAPLRPEKGAGEFAPIAAEPSPSGRAPGPRLSRPGAELLGVVSPLRPGTAGEVPIEPPPPVAPPLESVDADPLDGDDDEPPLPEEELARVAQAAVAPTVPVEAGADQVLHVRFNLGAGTEQAMEEFRTLIRSRPGATRVILHVPTGRGAAELPMELRTGVAYDADLLAEVGRRLGGGAIELSLG